MAFFMHTLDDPNINFGSKLAHYLIGYLFDGIIFMVIGLIYLIYYAITDHDFLNIMADKMKEHILYEYEDGKFAIKQFYDNNHIHTHSLCETCISNKLQRLCWHCASYDVVEDIIDFNFIEYKQPRKTLKAWDGLQ